MPGICPECRNYGKEVRNQTVNSLTKRETEAQRMMNIISVSNQYVM